MIRGNLSTRPFYNERAAAALVALVALLALGFTLFNIYRIVSLSARSTALGAEVRTEEEAARRMRLQAAALRGRIDQAQVKAVMAGAQEANALIDQRTFSWTEFFNLIERTLPEDVMLTSVSPDVQQNRTVVVMTVVGRSADDVDAFMEQLEATKAFLSVLPRSEIINEEGLHEVVLSAEYAAPAGADGTPGEEGGAAAPGVR